MKLPHLRRTFIRITCMATISAECDPGYYCTGGAYLPNPNDNTTGSICPQHYICPQGSSEPQACPIGYYANNTGLWECSLCLSGFICYPEEAPRVCPQGTYSP